MKKLLTLSFILVGFSLFGQTYLISSGGTQSTCSGSFYDSGGSIGNYTNNQNYTMTFCSSTPGQAIQMAFTSFNTESGYDFLYFFDGANTSASSLGFATGVGTFTVAAPSGCLTVQFISDVSNVSTGWAATISCIAPFYTHPTVGIAGEFVGACLVNNCGPFNYYDNGGPSGNYSDNIGSVGYGGIYRVFCPNTAGNCMRVTFNSFATQGLSGTGVPRDYLTIGNGPVQNSPYFTTSPAITTGIYAGYILGTPSVPFSYTSTDASGCLTFRFFSNNSTNAAGWSATLQCVPCATGPTGTSNSDCSNATALCSGAPVSSIATGPGLVAEGCNGVSCPAGGENYSNWYHFYAQTTGTLMITLTPANPLDDYDFMIYTGASCGSLTQIRCSDAAVAGTTGAFGTSGAANTDLTEDASGNGVLRYLDVVAGQSLYLQVDEWSPNGGGGYGLSFSGGTASLDCAILPIELAEFNAEYQNDLDIVDVSWITNSEHNSDYFLVEKSTDGKLFEIINRVEAVGESQLETQYYTTDENPIVGVNYYRLKQFDKNGDFKYSDIRSVNILDDVYDMITDHVQNLWSII